MSGLGRAIGGALEIAAGIGLGAATSSLGVAAAVVVAHGVDQVQAGVREMAALYETKSVTQSALEKAGVPEKAYGYVDAGLGVALSTGGGLATASIKVAAIRAPTRWRRDSLA